MSTSYIDEQKLRLETLQNDLSVRQQQLEAQQVPPPEFIHSPSSGGSRLGAPPSSAGPPFLSKEERP
jgi:hypothetical protein